MSGQPKVRWRRIHMEQLVDLDLPKGEDPAHWGKSICSPYPAKRARGAFGKPKDAWKFTCDPGRVTCLRCHNVMLKETR